ncbi:hypothetical protein BD410DRAFT_789352 [Rickenella mellea]|uniref:Uncharacterized protein n=1 Tax=Rickenella mellea TaxID=50990 RepID=A0A4Y7Q1T6_9AGAM|nr:hypothetical protein BD410DRAFT_789352 [Rickenella mellea]
MSKSMCDLTSMKLNSPFRMVPKCLITKQTTPEAEISDMSLAGGPADLHCGADEVDFSFNGNRTMDLDIKKLGISRRLSITAATEDSEAHGTATTAPVEPRPAPQTAMCCDALMEWDSYRSASPLICTSGNSTFLSNHVTVDVHLDFSAQVLVIVLR